MGDDVSSRSLKLNNSRSIPLDKWEKVFGRECKKCKCKFKLNKDNENNKFCEKCK